MLSTTNAKTRTLVNRLRRVAYRQGFRVIKIRERGFVLVDIRDPEKAVLGGERVSGASLKDVAKFLKVAA